MSRRTAVEDLFNYSSGGGEACRGGRRKGRTDGCWGGKKIAKMRNVTTFTESGFRPFSVRCERVLFKTFNTPHPCLQMVGFFFCNCSFFLITYHLQLLTGNCCRVLRTGRVTGHQYRVRHPVMLPQTPSPASHVHPHRMYRCARSTLHIRFLLKPQ